MVELMPCQILKYEGINVDEKEKKGMRQIENSLQDYVLRCIGGPHKGKFIYLNLTSTGETIGSAPQHTLCIENAGLSANHATIKYDPQSRNYTLWDTNSETGVWIQCRPDTPILVQDQIEFEIDERRFILSFVDGEFDAMDEWLLRIDLLMLKDYLISENIKQLEDLRKLKLQNDLTQEMDRMGINEVERAYFQAAIHDIDDDFPSDGKYIKRKMELLDVKTGLKSLVSWSGMLLGSFDNADLHIEADIPTPNTVTATQIELVIKYQYGNYWLIPSKRNQSQIFARLQSNDHQILIPDDIIKMAQLQFVIQRFNCGWYEDYGTRLAMEDMTVIKQELGVSYRLNFSFFAVYDGHGGIDCVKYIAEYMVENLRTLILRSEVIFDDQKDFYRYMHDTIIKAVKDTDMDFQKEYLDYANESGCTACIVLIVGNIIFCANIGDSRAVLCRNGNALPLSVDHKPNNPKEEKRIIEANGTVQQNRIFGKLAVSRAFGDFNYKPKSMGKIKQYKDDLVSVMPEIRTCQIDVIQDEFIIIGCDGLFDNFTNQECVKRARSILSAQPLMMQDPQAAIKQIVKEAVAISKENKHNADNCSSILLTLNRGICSSNIKI